MDLPKGFTRVVTDLNLGLNSWTPNDKTGYVQFDHGETLPDDGGMHMSVGSTGYGGRAATVTFTREAWQKFLAVAIANEKIMSDLCKPIGVRLVPLVGDPIDVPEGTGIRLVGDMLAIIGAEGKELQMVKAAEYSIQWLRPLKPGKEPNDE